jgi:hypothetical protein
MFGQKLRFGGQQIAASRAFGAADFQQQRGNLVLHLDRMHHPSAVFPGAIDEKDRGRTDRDQHQESRREQQDLPNRAAARGVKCHECQAQ